MNVALLNCRITFQRNEIVADEIGNRRNTWVDAFSCYATINSESGSEPEVAGQTVSQANAAFTVRFSKRTAAVTSDAYRIRWGDELYNITYIDHQNNKRKSLKFWVEKVRR